MILFQLWEQSPCIRVTDFLKWVQRYYSVQNTLLLKLGPNNELGPILPCLINMRPLEFSWEVNSAECRLFKKFKKKFAKLFFFQTSFWLELDLSKWTPLFLTVLFQIHFSSALLLHILFRLTLNVIIIPTISFTVIYGFIKALRFLFRFLICWLGSLCII